MTLLFMYQDPKPKQNCHPDRSVPGFPATLHWTRPRMRLSVRERRMKCTNATKFHRKSGVAKRRDLRCALRASQILPVLTQTLKPILNLEHSSAGLKSSSPLLE